MTCPNCKSQNTELVYSDNKLGYSYECKDCETPFVKEVTGS